METNDLIADLSSDLKPVKSGAMTRLLIIGLVGGGVFAAALMVVWLGLRPDLQFASSTPAFWMKAAYTVAMAAIGFALVLRAGRPGARVLPAAVFALVAVLAMASMGGMQMMRAPSDLRPELFFGGSYTVCPWMIVALSLPILVTTVLVMRRMAPTSPTVAGGVAGLFAGAAGATIYGLHCTESSAMFVAFWYTLGIAGVAALGAILGRFTLRW